MTLLQPIIGVLLILGGLTFMLIGSIGLIRLPDFFTRTHSASKIDTAGILVVMLGAAVLSGLNLTTVKVLLAMMFVMLANPVAAHALSRAALREGVRPWKRGETPPTTGKE